MIEEQSSHKGSLERDDGSYVYFIGAVGGPIKIGCSASPRSRRNELQVGSAQSLLVLATVPGGEALERALHHRFADHRLNGEWFAPTPELLMLIWETGAGSRLVWNDPGDSGLVARFARERLRRVSNRRIKSSQLFSVFQAWCSDQGVDPIGQVGFSAALQSLGYRRKRSDGMQWINVDLRSGRA